MRTFLALLLGFALWSALWVGGHQAALSAWPSLYDEGGIPRASATYAGYLVFSVLCSLLAGGLARLVAAQGSRAVLVLGLLLVGVGIGFQASVWSQEPLWYHLVFLGLLLPATLAGGRRRAAA
ncbi:MAG TPA: hypothetical protein VF530_01700 [Planctomycetota bacterium]